MNGEHACLSHSWNIFVLFSLPQTEVGCWICAEMGIYPGHFRVAVLIYYFRAADNSNSSSNNSQHKQHHPDITIVDSNLSIQVSKHQLQKASSIKMPNRPQSRAPHSSLRPSIPTSQTQHVSDRHNQKDAHVARYRKAIGLAPQREDIMLHTAAGPAEIPLNDDQDMQGGRGARQ